MKKYLLLFIIQTSQSKHNFLDQGIPGVRVSSGEGQMRGVAVRALSSLGYWSLPRGNRTQRMQIGMQI